MPTLLDLLGVAHPAGMDGRSWLPLLKGEKQEGRDFVVTHVNTVSSGQLSAALRADERPRPHVPRLVGRPDQLPRRGHERPVVQCPRRRGQTDPRIAARVEQYTKGTPLALYDLTKDPDERTNLINDPAYQSDLQRLTKLLLAHMEKTSDPQLAAFQAALGR